MNIGDRRLPRLLNSFPEIVEGVESPDEVTPLSDLKCQLAQGYHRGMPLDAVETEGLLRALAS